ncbi:hypothetical protein P7C73_g2113, partial [Tremellales sp. Uapishka_1]
MNAPDYNINADGVNGPLNPFGIAPPAPDAGLMNFVHSRLTMRLGERGRDPGLRQAVRRLCEYSLTKEREARTEPFAAYTATVDFGLHFPRGTKVPGGFLLPVSVKKKAREEEKKTEEPNPICRIQ